MAAGAPDRSIQDNDLPAALFGVERSATGRRWSERLDAGGRSEATRIVQHAGVPDVVARVLAGRDVDAETAEDFLDPKLRQLLPDPRELTDMEAAGARLARAVENQERVVIFGDYDVDGATSSALLWRFLAANGVAAEIVIPDRVRDGYGPTVAVVDQIAEQGAGLLVTVDCGTASYAPFARARELGLDVVAADHHQAEADLPDALALVNPNRQDDLSGCGYLAAVGVTFLVVIETHRQLRDRGWYDGRKPPDLMGWLDLVALGTVADVVPLTGLNRALVRQGLRVANGAGAPGLQALRRVARVHGELSPYHLGFVLGPRINAGGRIGDASLGARLLTTDHPDIAIDIAGQLDRLNEERQALERTILDEAIAQVAANGIADEPVIATSGDADWHPGVLGLIAARLREAHDRPAMTASFDEEGRGTGSARSIPGADIGEAVRAAAAAGLIEKGGGHAMAAGFSLSGDQWLGFVTHMHAALAEAVATSDHIGKFVVDAALTAGGATVDLVNAVSRAGPFGTGNPEPVFGFPAHRLADATPLNGGHIRATLIASDGARLKAMAFRALDRPFGDALLASRDRMVHAAGTLRIDRWNGRESVLLSLQDIAPATR